MLVQLITAPIAILFDAISFLVSAVSVFLIRKPEPAVSHEPAEQAASHRGLALRVLLIRCCVRWRAFHHDVPVPWIPGTAVRSVCDSRASPCPGGAWNRDCHGRRGESWSGATFAPAIGRRFGLGHTFIGSVLDHGLRLRADPAGAWSATAAADCS